MLPVATFWLPSLNPIGPPSLLAALLVVVATLLSSRRLRPRDWERFLGPAQAVVMIASVLAIIWPARFRDADDLVAVVVLVAFGFGLGLAGYRSSRVLLRVSGVISTTLYGAFIALFGTARLWPWYPTLQAWWFAAGFVVVWLPVAIVLYRRAARFGAARRGCCHVCGYDLRGSLEAGRCPECGTPIRHPEFVPLLETSDAHSPRPAS